MQGSNPSRAISPGRRAFLGHGVKLGAYAASTLLATGCDYFGPAPETRTRLEVPEGFTPRLVARSGHRTVDSSSFRWHSAPDGGGCFEADAQGWYYVSNCEENRGGVGVLKFDADGTVIDSYSILDRSTKNCSGGETPWGTWLSCEEIHKGLVWECDPENIEAARPLPALGLFMHESISVDPLSLQIYMTEDNSEGGLYRFTPASIGIDMKPDLTQGLLEVAVVNNGFLAWETVPDPEATKEETRRQVSQSARFKGGEGIDIHNRYIRFTTKHDNHVWELNLNDSSIRTKCDMSSYIHDVDDLTHSPSGKVLIAEDGGMMRLYYFPEDSDSPELLLRIPDHTESEITGLAFSPDGSRLYFSSQRGSTGRRDDGLTFELSGDFSNLKPGGKMVKWTLDHREQRI